MEAIGGVTLLKTLSEFGTIGLILFLWWYDQRCIRQILAQYKQDMDEQRKMYESNVSLCRSFADLSGDLKSIIVLNTQTLTRMCDRLEKNR
jgi:hypothetical protein